MRLSTHSRYGVRAVFDIAFHSGGLETQVKDISRRQAISPRYLEQIFQKLKKGGIVGSKRGPAGGYFLKKRAEEITVEEVVRSTEGDISLVLCLKQRGAKNVKKRCQRMEECVTQEIWKEAGNRLKGYLSSVTIADLCKMAEKKGLKRELGKKFMYYI